MLVVYRAAVGKRVQ